MEGNQRKRVSRLKIAKIQVTVFLLFVFGVGFIAGMLVGRATVSKQAEEIVNDTSVEIESLSTSPPADPTDSTETVYKEPPIVFYDVPLTSNLQEYIMLLCEKKEVPVPLVMAMIEHESTFRAEVISKTDDYGLMQINEGNHEWLSDIYEVTDFLDSYQNVYCGISIISGYLEKYEDIPLALMCYNMGEYGANQLWKTGVHSTAYSRNVIAKMTKYEEVNDANGNDG